MEVEIYISDGKEYGLIKKQKVNDITFCYFVNMLDNTDIIIKKYDGNKNIISISENEFQTAIKFFNN